MLREIYHSVKIHSLNLPKLVELFNLIKIWNDALQWMLNNALGHASTCLRTIIIKIKNIINVFKRNQLKFAMLRFKSKQKFYI